MSDFNCTDPLRYMQHPLSEGQYTVALAFFPNTKIHQHRCEFKADQVIFMSRRQPDELILVKFETVPSPDYPPCTSQTYILWRRLPSTGAPYRLGVFDIIGMKQIDPLCEFTRP